MVSYLNLFFEKYDYPIDSREVLLNAYDAILNNPETRSFIDNSIKTYSEDMNCDFNLLFNEAEKISEKLCIHEYTVKLLLLICLSEAMRKHYETNGYSEDLFNNTILDLKYKLIECKLIKGIDGTFVANWINGFFNLTRFGFKRLQFEMRTAKVDYLNESSFIKAGDPVINVHKIGRAHV